MEKEIQPTTENAVILKQYVEQNIKKAMKEKYPTAEDVVNDLLKTK